MSEPTAAARALDADPDVDRRRRRAHRRAVVAFTEGLVLRALYGATLVLVVIGAVAAAEVWLVDDRRFRDAWVWGLLPGGVATIAIALLVGSAAFLAWAALRGAGTWLLRGVRHRPLSPYDGERITNVVHALSLGLGIQPPWVGVIDDPAPNAISARVRGAPVLLVTSGALSGLPRDELEAMCAHELGHLHAADARLVAAAFMTLVRARNLSVIVGGLGFAVVGLGFEAGSLSVIVFGLTLAAVSFGARALLDRPLLRLRRDTDDVADCVAVHLSRHPEALATLLSRLYHDHRRVATTSDRCEHLWFEVVTEGAPVPAGFQPPQALLTESNRAGHAELARRWANAAATAAGITR
ncbi:MAG: M48 family metalloprotease [Acidimicrobiia bacterium]|nr:M48 family metalloprotease [Acidimicrobiia bacterium]